MSLYTWRKHMIRCFSVSSNLLLKCFVQSHVLPYLEFQKEFQGPPFPWEFVVTPLLGFKASVTCYTFYYNFGRVNICYTYPEIYFWCYTY